MDEFNLLLHVHENGSYINNMNFYMMKPMKVARYHFFLYEILNQMKKIKLEGYFNVVVSRISSQKTKRSHEDEIDE